MSAKRREHPLAGLLVPAYHAAWDAFATGAARELWLKGGRGSLKSTFAAYAVVMGVMARPGVNAMVVRKHLADVRGSVYNQVAFAIERLDEAFPGRGILSRWRFRQNPADMTFDGERQIVFHGLDDPRKRKSERPAHGYFGYLWFEEFDEFAGMAEVSSLKKSVLRGGPVGQSVFTFNPPMSTSSWVNAEAARRRPGRYVFHSSYLDVLPHHPEWLGETFIDDAEDLRLSDERMYRHELLGEAVGTGGEVFSNVEDFSISDERIASFRAPLHGMDFGFTNDPTALVSCAYDRDARVLYVYAEDVRHGLFTDQIAEMVERRGLAKAAVVADAAEPRVIGELRYRGLNVRPCFKNANGWREDGLRWMRSLAAIRIDSRRCPVAFGEFSRYEYGRYANGDLRTEYPDGDDHAIDAVRYACEPEIRRDVMRRQTVAPRAFAGFGR